MSSADRYFHIQLHWGILFSQRYFLWDNYDQIPPFFMMWFEFQFHSQDSCSLQNTFQLSNIPLKRAWSEPKSRPSYFLTCPEKSSCSFDYSLYFPWIMSVWWGHQILFSKLDISALTRKFSGILWVSEVRGHLSSCRGYFCNSSNDFLVPILISPAPCLGMPVAKFIFLSQECWCLYLNCMEERVLQVHIWYWLQIYGSLT